MSVPETTAATREPSLARERLRALRYHLAGRRGLLALAGLGLVSLAAGAVPPYRALRTRTG